MEIKQLEIFVCVAKKLSFSKAAEDMYISQPTVSAQISALEKSLGAGLLVRNTKGVSLTKSGEDFLQYAQKILTLRDQALQSTTGRNKELTGTIDIISSTIPAQHLLPALIASYQKSWPNIVFRVEQADSERVISEIGGFQYDFGMIGTVPKSDRFVHYPIYDDEFVLVTPKNFPHNAPAIQKNFTQVIKEFPFIMREAGSGTRAETENLLTKVGVDINELKVPAYFADTHSILSAVASGMGVSLVSKVAASMYVEAGLLTAVDMNDSRFGRQIHLIYKKELWLSPSQQAFAEHVRGYYGN